MISANVLIRQAVEVKEKSDVSRNYAREKHIIAGEKFQGDAKSMKGLHMARE